MPILSPRNCIAAAMLIHACTAGAQQSAVPEDARPQDARVFTLDPSTLPFNAVSDTQAETDRWWGLLGGSGYRVEVPRNWNGSLVMWAHGYAGDSPQLEADEPPFRRYLIEHGYAWASSSFSRNNYDVRAGIEDTNALALAFTAIAAQNNRPLPAPSRLYIAGGSMGGHVAAAAVETETLATARNPVRYDGALPLCGAVADTELFDYLAAYQLATQYFGGKAAAAFPATDFQQLRPELRDALWYIYPAAPKEQGRQLKNAVMNLTGGARPLFELSFKLRPYQDAVWNRFGTDGTLDGILAFNVADTTRIVYQEDNDPALSADEALHNSGIVRAVASPEANRPRRDGLRWVPKVNGQFSVPVLTMHTLGDLYVPFSMEQSYRRRAIANGNDALLVQRAIRSPGHCEFTVAEEAAAFEALVNWVQTGAKPAGDDVLTPTAVADGNYGCTFTNDATGPDDNRGLSAIRKLVPGCPGR
ncbi:alpha/beta hydrolase [Oxalobacteraceae bacterium OM1]|nr:alpha/beta hydrolase [Oxalobacteraceae bacterium OM1]